MGADQLFLAAVTGGLAGSALTLISQALIRWWVKPSLAIAFDRNTPGCEVSAPAGSAVLQRHLRLKIANRGRTMARGVSVSMLGLDYSAPAGARETVFDDEVLDLKWAQAGTVRIDIPSKGHRFIDIMHVEKPRDGVDGVVTTFDFLATPMRLDALGWSDGTYRAKLFVAAANAASRSDTIAWTSNGTFEGLSIGG